MQYIKKILNKEILQQILDCFVELTNIRVAYFEDYNESVSGKNKGICRFCTLLRQFPHFMNECLSSDKEAFMKAGKLKRYYLYKCHMGIWEAVIPVIIHDFVVGYLMLGQIKCMEDSQNNWEYIENKLKRNNIPCFAINEIKEAYDGMFTLHEEKIRAAVKMLDIVARHMVNTDIVHIFEMEAIEKAKEYIKFNFKNQISVRMIADHIGLSHAYFSFLFKRETGVTVTSYIKRLRIKHAGELLKITTEPVKSIAFMAGYHDQNYFSRVFKNETGMSPIEYRIKNKK